jgi:hypothetical protein
MLRGLKDTDSCRKSRVRLPLKHNAAAPTFKVHCVLILLLPDGLFRRERSVGHERDLPPPRVRAGEEVRESLRPTYQGQPRG